MDDKAIFRASLLQKRSKELESTLDIIKSQISELEDFGKNLMPLFKEGEGKILASLGRGVYAPAILEDKELFVEIGSGVVLKKSLTEVKSTIDSQIMKLNEIRLQLIREIENYSLELRKIISSINKKSESKTI